ncbi:hypothetical protein [Vibrio maerlii]|uniref:hypothetical protein n=1 Tax=Vibrio maerlii TaxID=2231648 RepID=UPI000E3DA4DD|nr:hypothetical protein [Vibrio maerlii]
MNRPILTLTLIIVSSLHPAIAKNVEIALKHQLDGFLSGYCLDMVGQGEKASIDKPLQSHTCYSYRGSLGIDQAFDSEKLTQNQLYITQFDVCAELSELSVGAQLNLNTCDQSELQQIEMTNEGLIRPIANSDLCLSSGLTTKRGRNGTSDHQIKTLTLQECSDSRAHFQEWYGRSAE